MPTGDVTLKLYDGQGLSTIDDALIAAFTEKYPNITIEPTYDPDDVTTQNQPRQLASATPPDLIRVISVTSGVKNNLLTNLDAYSDAYGWDQLRRRSSPSSGPRTAWPARDRSMPSPAASP